MSLSHEPRADDWLLAPDGRGEVLTGARRLEADISLLLLCLATADPLARFWAMHALRTARGMGLVR